MSACIYPGAGELLVYEDSELLERLRFVDSLGTIVHFWPCLRVAIAVSASGPGAQRQLLYRVLRFGREVELIHQFGAGAISISAAGLTEIADPQQLLVESVDSMNVWVSTSGRREILSLHSSGCASSDVAPTSQIVALRLDGDEPVRLAGSRVSVSRKLAFFQSERSGLTVGTLSGDLMEVWSCPAMSECRLRSSLSTSDRIVLSFLCDDSICSIATSRNDSLVVVRHRIE
jgi:hypothetical protein